MNNEIVRYAINGLVATVVHFCVLTICVEVIEIPSAAISNIIAAGFGITTSFLGSRYFVFRRRHDPILSQAAKFTILYASIATLHGLVLFVWTDIFAMDYRIGFLIATVLQVLISYIGNKKLVFK